MSSGKTEKMLKIIVAAAVAVSFVSLDVANAASKKEEAEGARDRASQLCGAGQPAHAGAALARTG